MKDEDRKNLIDYRMKRAEETLEEARIMAREEHYNCP
jgi:hypothetical protein